MGLESLLTRLEGRAVTPVTPGHTGGVTEKATTKQSCYTCYTEKVDGTPAGDAERRRHFIASAVLRRTVRPTFFAWRSQRQIVVQ
jgi:hypothetical protein